MKHTHMKHTDIAHNVITSQGDALAVLAKNIPADFAPLIDCILALKGRVILVGMGKSGYIAKKIAASLASTGTPAFFTHPAEASHGDLGMITKADLVIMLSNSGETKELFDTIDYCKRYNIKIASITMKEGSTLAKNSDFLLKLPTQKESSAIAAPTTSALMTLSLGDSIVTALHEAKDFTKEDFKNFHPGGKIGANLLKVQDIMNSGEQLPVVSGGDAFADVIIKMNSKCLGCAVIVDESKTMLGIITDGDLRRHIGGDLSKISAKDVMTPSFQSISPNALATEALFIMNDKSITALPVLEDGLLVGVVHIHDILKAGVS
ncbi:MAG: KpsF/GutQ family sugar-phosphate isomerase [Rickettsiales bacterium]|nr:MAG: KpsF/GutQ family sugar-phosphate isomerase [Rickettsiales bacterium]